MSLKEYLDQQHAPPEIQEKLERLFALSRKWKGFSEASLLVLDDERMDVKIFPTGETVFQLAKLEASKAACHAMMDCAAELEKIVL